MEGGLYGEVREDETVEQLECGLSYLSGDSICDVPQIMSGQKQSCSVVDPPKDPTS